MNFYSSIKFKSTLFLFAFLALNSCQDKCTETRTYERLTPLVASLEDIRSSFSVEESRTLENPKKIYVYQDLLFVVDEYQGFQILDNSDPSNPSPMQFVKLLGCTDVAVRNGIIYANQGPDLVSINYDGAGNLQIIQRAENVMDNHIQSEDGFVYGFLKEWVTEEVECSTTNRNGGVWFGAENDFATTSSGSSGGTGGGGSMARFSIIENLIYVVDRNNISTLDLAGLNVQNSTAVSWNVETLFGTDKYLFLGTTTGMFIYNRNNGAEPTYVGGFTHARGCDPVVVQGDYAFVTLRGDGDCGEADDALYVVDISNISSPKLHSQHAMFGPRGLGVNGNTLMICDGTKGLRIFDKSDLNQILKNEIATVSDVDSYDVILLENRFILSTADGVYQYDYTDPSKPVYLSKIYAK